MGPLAASLELLCTVFCGGYYVRYFAKEYM